MPLLFAMLDKSDDATNCCYFRLCTLGECKRVKASQYVIQFPFNDMIRVSACPWMPLPSFFFFARNQPLLSRSNAIRIVPLRCSKQQPLHLFSHFKILLFIPFFGTPCYSVLAIYACLYFCTLPLHCSQRWNFSHPMFLSTHSTP
jgi:hypothetical protein